MLVGFFGSEGERVLEKEGGLDGRVVLWLEWKGEILFFESVLSR